MCLHAGPDQLLIVSGMHFTTFSEAAGGSGSLTGTRANEDAQLVLVKQGWTHPCVPAFSILWRQAKPRTWNPKKPSCILQRFLSHTKVSGLEIRSNS